MHRTGESVEVGGGGHQLWQTAKTLIPSIRALTPWSYAVIEPWVKSYAANTREYLGFDPLKYAPEAYGSEDAVFAAIRESAIFELANLVCNPTSKAFASPFAPSSLLLAVAFQRLSRQ